MADSSRRASFYERRHNWYDFALLVLGLVVIIILRQAGGAAALSTAVPTATIYMLSYGCHFWTATDESTECSLDGPFFLK